MFRIRSLAWLPAVAALLLSYGCATTDGASVNARPGPPARLVVHLTGVETGEGRMLVFVHDNSRSYHSDDDTTSAEFSAFRSARTAPVVPTTTVVFEAVPAGRYAVSAYHDEDGNGVLNRQILPFTGMPSEPYGISNNVSATLSKAPFEEALIKVRAPLTEVTIPLSTHLRKLMGG